MPYLTTSGTEPLDDAEALPPKAAIQKYRYALGYDDHQSLPDEISKF
jgi:hypothetical protein